MEAAARQLEAARREFMVEQGVAATARQKLTVEAAAVAAAEATLAEKKATLAEERKALAARRKEQLADAEKAGQVREVQRLD